MDCLRFKHPCSIIIAGPSGSGKSCLVNEILDNLNLFKNFPKKHNIVWSYGQPAFERRSGVRYLEHIPSEKELNSLKPDLLIIDDMMVESSKDNHLLNIFTKFSHHKRISVIFIIQNLFFKSPIMRSLSLNAHYIFLMKNPRDRSQIMHLARQVYPEDMNFLIKAYKAATKYPYTHFRLDLTPDTPDKYRFCSRITSKPLLFYPRNVC